MLFAHLSETEKHKYLMAVCFVMSQGIRNRSRARKKVKIKIANSTGPKQPPQKTKELKIYCIFIVKFLLVPPFVLFFDYQRLAFVRKFLYEWRDN